MCIFLPFISTSCALDMSTSFWYSPTLITNEPIFNLKFDLIVPMKFILNHITADSTTYEWVNHESPYVGAIHELPVQKPKPISTATFNI